jgi:peptidoglycan/xylan/chitin deacetylase (PgdA/CDA1 family)
MRSMIPVLCAVLLLSGCGGSSHKAAKRVGGSLPANGAAGIKRYTPPVGATTGCTPRGPIYTEALHARSKVVALTFDDGPSEYTHRVLDVLERAHARATFFVIGNQVTDYPEQLRRELRDGDMIGDHTWTHPDMTQLPIATQLGQLQLTLQAVQAATGFTPCLWRAPYGAINAQLEYLARALGLLSIQWDVDPQDFDAPPAAAIVQRVIHGNPKNPDKGVHPGAIVLMHDGGGNRSHTVSALPQIIAALRAQGYRFVTIPELLRLRVTVRAK